MATIGDQAALERLASRLREYWLPGQLDLVAAVALNELRDWLADEHW